MHIGIVRLSSLGDVVHTLPVAAAVKAALPNAVVTWMIEENERELIDGNPAVDHAIVVPLRRWKRTLGRGNVAAVSREARELARTLRSARFDAVIDPQGWVHKTSPIVVMTHAPIRIGFAATHSRDRWSPLFTNRHVTPPKSAVHIVDQNLALLEPLRIVDPAAVFPLPSWSGADRRVDDWLKQHQIAGYSLIALLPSTRGPRKLWPAVSYATLAARLAGRTDARVLLAGGPGDKAVLDAVEAGCHQVHVFHAATIGDLAALLARASLVIGNDTGPLHLAAAADVPALGLFGPTSGRRNGPYGRNGHVIQSTTGRMADIRVETVFETAFRIFRTRKPEPFARLPDSCC